MAVTGTRDLVLRLARWLLILLVPVVLVLTSVRLLMTDAFIRLEYRMPGFPEDSYGFTLEDRLRWAPIALDYLMNDEGIEFLADLQFDNGEPVYNARELRHMVDVKMLTQGALKVWAASLGALVLLVGGLALSGARDVAAEGLRRGAELTLAVMVALGLALFLGFSIFFVGFHRVFFQGNTWLFAYSDTLIRLFPERFWRDAFIFIALGTLLGAFLVRGLVRWVRTGGR